MLRHDHIFLFLFVGIFGNRLPKLNTVFTEFLVILVQNNKNRFPPKNTYHSRAENVHLLPTPGMGLLYWPPLAINLFDFPDTSGPAEHPWRCGCGGRSTVCDHPQQLRGEPQPRAQLPGLTGWTQGASDPGNGPPSRIHVSPAPAASHHQVPETPWITQPSQN